jgi:short-subunit dehydrogenase
MIDSLEDKTVIITGGSEGVGAAAAHQFAAAGANLVLVARTRKNLDLIVDELRGQTHVISVAMDVCDEDACINLFKKASFEFGSIHVLVNNAGCHNRGLVENLAVEDFGKMIDVNFKAPVILSRLAIPYIKESGGGAIINIASLAGRAPISGAATYSATKFALRAFTFALGQELRGTGIKLAAVSPGPIDTGFIMSNIDEVADITFSQPICTGDDVAKEIVKICTNDKRERSITPMGGMLTTIAYLFPAISRLLQPALNAKGRRVKKKLKAKLRAASETES